MGSQVLILVAPFFMEAEMEKDKRDLYQEADNLREIIQSLQGQNLLLMERRLR